MADKLSAQTDAELRQRVLNALAVQRVALRSGWVSRLPVEEHETGIMLLNGKHSYATQPEELVNAFRVRGITLTAYRGQTIRLSMPSRTFSAEDLLRIDEAFQRVGTPAEGGTVGVRDRGSNWGQALSGGH